MRSGRTWPGNRTLLSPQPGTGMPCARRRSAYVPVPRGFVIGMRPGPSYAGGLDRDRHLDRRFRHHGFILKDDAQPFAGIFQQHPCLCNSLA